MWKIIQRRYRVLRSGVFFSLIISLLTPYSALVTAQEAPSESSQALAPTTTSETITEPGSTANETTGAIVPVEEGMAAPEETSPEEEPSSPPPQTESSSEDYHDYENTRQKGNAKLEVTPDESTGALTLSFPITVPPGRNGLEPDLVVSYNSRDSDNLSQFGYYGWSINIPYIERINKTGIEDMYSQYYFHSSMDGELATTTAGTTDYGAKVENGSFLQYEFINNTSWQVTDKAGTVYTFGEATSTRQYDTGSTTVRIFKWMLEEVRDRNDNYISYEYTRNANQLYPSRITYTGSGATPGIFDVEFTLDTRGYSASSTATGFPVSTSFRVSTITTEINNSWVRRYDLAYTTGDNGVRALLSSITETGRGEDGNTLALPPTTFTYATTSGRSWPQNANYIVPVDFVDSSGDPYGKGVRAIDADGDSLPDLVYGDETVFLNKGDGTGWATTTAYTGPTSFVASDRSPRIMEINGDGFQDIATSKSGVKYVYLNNADNTGWSTSTTHDIPTGFENADGSDVGTRIMDLDGDGLHDIVRSAYNDSHTVYINDGDGTGWTADSTYTIPFDFVDATGNGWNVLIMDYNADGLGDLVKIFDYIYYNKGDGTGWFSGSGSVPNDFSNFDGEGAGHSFDANGDGLPDLIRADSDPRTFLNDGDGSGWTEAGGSYPYTLPLTFVDLSGNSKGVMVIDADGDGMLDIVRSQNGTRAVYINNGNVPDLLTTVKASAGATTTISYKASPQYTESGKLLNPRLPLTLMLVDTITTTDPLSNGTAATYTYGDGLYYYASEYDKEFAGFATTTKTDASGFVTKTFYHQGTSTNANIGKYSDHISKRGKPYRTEVYDASGNLYSKTITQWDRADLGNTRNFVKKTREVHSTYDGDADHKDSAATYTYDNATGNLTYQLEYGEVTGSDDGTFADTGTDKFATTITYAASTTLNLYLPSQETVVDSASTTVKDTKHYYDSLALGSVDKGNETKTEFWKSGSSWIDTERTFNSYGLVTQEKDPRDKATSYVYDGYNLHVATSTNAKSQATHFYRDFSSGKVKETVDPNGLHFTTTFDAFDRPITEKQPDLTTPSTLATTTTFAYTDTRDARKVVKTNYLSTATTTESYTYLDGFDRTLQERIEAEDGNYMTRDFQYDRQGHLLKESLPYFSSSTARTASSTTATLYATYAYDPLNRVISLKTAVGTTTHAYDQWEEVVTDVNAHPKDLHHDAYNRLTTVEERNSTTTATTTYEYNYLGNLTKITDALANIRNFTYDGLGRRAAGGDLHALTDISYGTTTYTYDPAGNLATSTDPKSQTVEYSYDDLNRVLTENYTGASGTEVTYTYDGCTYGVGRLCGATTTTAGTNFLYNGRGFVASERKTVDGSAYTTSYTYDRQGNQTQITYPDSAIVQYEYNGAGQLETVAKKESGESTFTSVVTDFDYAPHGAVSVIRYSNDAATENTYDAAELYRLKKKLTTAPAGGGGGMGGFEEVVERPSYQTVTYEIVPGRYRTEGYQHHINYRTSAGSFEAVDTTLTDSITDEGSWDFDTASYRPVVPKTADGWFEFHNTFEGAGDMARMRPVGAGEISGILSPSGSEVLYTDALGAGTDLKVSLTPMRMDKVIVLNNAPTASTTPDRVFEFEMESSAAPVEDPDGTVHLGTITIFPAEAWDSAGRRIPIETEIVHKAGSTTYRKTIPASFLTTATFPIYTDDSTGFTNSGTQTDDSAVGTVTWGSVTNVASDNGTNATAITGFANAETHYARVTNFGFAITNGNQIDGIEVKTDCQNDSGTGGSGDIVVERVRLYVSGAFAGDDKAPGTQECLNTDTQFTYGAAGDTWGNSLTEAIVEASNFGTGATLRNTNVNGRDGAMDWVAVNVYHSGSPTTTIQNLSYTYDRVGNITQIAEQAATDAERTVGYSYDDLNRLTTATTTLPEGQGGMGGFGAPQGKSLLLDDSLLPPPTDEPLAAGQRFLGYPREVERPSYQTVTYETAAGKYKTEGYQHHVNYQTAGGSFEAIDTTLKDSATAANSWDFDTASYRPVVPKTADGWFEFHNTFEGASDMVRMRPVGAGEISGILSPSGSEVLYTDALGAGTDLKVSLTPMRVDKVIVLNNAPTSSTTPDRVFEFEMESSAAPVEDPDGTVHMGDTIIFPAEAWDSAGRRIPIETEIVHKAGSTTYRKTIPASFLNTATFPVYTDDSTGFTNSGTQTDDSSVGTVTWGSVASVVSDNGTNATAVTGFANAETHYARVTNFGFAITNGNQIDGIEVKTDCQNDSGTGGSGDIVVERVRLYVSGAFAGDDKAPGTQECLNTDTQFTYGAAGDTWGNSLTEAIVEASNFGTGAILRNTNVNGRDGAMDWVAVNVYHSTPASGAAATTTFSYNAIGNITNKSDTGSYMYAGTNYANPHAPTTISGTTYSYDNNGNLTGHGSSSYGWDYRNELTQTATGTATTTFAYDHTGARVAMRTTGTATTTYANRFYDVNGATTTKHIYANGMLIGTIEHTPTATTTYTIHTDHLGGTNVVTDSDGTVVQTLDYAPFGSVRVDVKASAFNEGRKFIGEEFDAVTSLSYLNARYYAGARGVFLSLDPAFLNMGVDKRTGQMLRDPQLLNSYSYSRNNPVVIKDPDGELGVFALFAIGALVNVTAQAIEDITSGNLFQWQNYAGAAAGGVAGMAVLLSGSASFATGAVTSGVEDLTTQGLQIASGNMKLSGFDGLRLGIQTVTGGVFNKFGGLVTSKIPAARYGNTVLDAFAKYSGVGGTIRSFTPQIASKILTTQFIGSLPQSLGAGVMGNPSHLEVISVQLQLIETLVRDIEQQIQGYKSKPDLTNANRA